MECSGASGAFGRDIREAVGVAWHCLHLGVWSESQAAVTVAELKVRCFVSMSAIRALDQVTRCDVKTQPASKCSPSYHSPLLVTALFFPRTSGNHQ